MDEGDQDDRLVGIMGWEGLARGDSWDEGERIEKAYEPEGLDDSPFVNTLHLTA